MIGPIATRAPRSAPSRTTSLLVACELITLTALLASLASIAPKRAVAAGTHPAMGATGLPDAYNACAHFIAGGALPGRKGTAGAPPNIDVWQWSRLADGRFRVLGYSDARSAVGEPHRTYYQCDLVQLQAGRWRLDSLAVTTTRPT